MIQIKNVKAISLDALFAYFYVKNLCVLKN